MSGSTRRPLWIYFFGALPLAIFYKPIEDFIGNQWLFFSWRLFIFT